jgi:hypothetical protein
MPLILCPECGWNVSSKAKACPQCGYPDIRGIEHPERQNEVRQAPGEVVNALGIKLVPVPAGTFWMGDRGSQAQVAVSQDLYIGAFPITQGQ